MANIKDFTVDEQVTLFALIATNLLVKRIAMYTGASEEQTQVELQSAVSEVIRDIEVFNLRKYLDSHREGMEEAYRISKACDSAEQN